MAVLAVAGTAQSDAWLVHAHAGAAHAGAVHAGPALAGHCLP